MNWPDLLFIAVGLGMDAFAVSVSKGISASEVRVGHGLLCGLYFGGSQFLMPLIGFYAASGFRGMIEAYDHWIAFVLLALIGFSMIRESRNESGQNADFSFRTMIILAVATSIDALAVGASLAFLQVKILGAAALIGLVTFAMANGGVRAGHVFGARYKGKSELIGGIILLLIGAKILAEHLGLFSFL